MALYKSSTVKAMLDEQQYKFESLLNKSLYEDIIFKGSPLAHPRNFTNDLLKGYLDNELIFSIIDRIASKASSLPIILKDKNDNVVENHWVLDLLDQPNPDNTFEELLYSYYIYYLSLGNSYIYSHLLPSGMRGALSIMPAPEVEIIPGSWKMPIEGYRLLIGTQKIVLPKEDVFYTKLFNPRFNNGEWLYGLSPIQVASQIINTYNNGIERLDKSFEAGMPDIILNLKEAGIMTTEQIEEFKDNFDKKYAAKDGKKSAAFSFPVDVKQIGSSPIDLEIFTNSEFALRVLCNVYKVPSVLFNDKANSTYNNVEQARKDFYDDAVIPLNNSFSERLGKFLGIHKDGYKFEFDYSGVEVLQSSFYTKAQALESVSFLTVDEKREKLGYGPLTKNNKTDEKDSL